MVISTQISLDSSSKSLDLSSKSSNMLSKNIAGKTSKEVNSMIDNSQSNSKLSDKDNDFKKIMDSKVNERNSQINDKNSNENVSNEDISGEDISNEDIEDIKDELKNIKEDIKDNIDDEEKINKAIDSLLNILNNLLGISNKDENPELNQGEISMDNYSEILDTSSLLNKLLDVLNSEEAKSNLSSDVLSGMKDLLTDFAAQLSDEVQTTFKDNVKDNVTDILSKLTDMINESENGSEKVLSLEEMLNSRNSSNQGESSLTDTNNQSSESAKANEENSKEDKFLNSLLDDKKDNQFNNKINMFASRTQQVQGQNTENRGLSVNKVTFTNDVIKDVKYMVTNNIKELSVKVNPGNLGEITIKMVQEDGLMKANLKANSKETTALLLQNISEIKKELSEQNMKISEVNIELYNDDTTYFKNGSFSGTFSGGQEGNRNRAGSVNVSSGKSNIEQNEDVIDNNANIDSKLDFLA